MTMIFVSVLVGAALSLRFSILSLVPAAALALASTAAIGRANGDPVWSVGLTMALVATVLQVGYWLGSNPGILFRLLPLRSMMPAQLGSVALHADDDGRTPATGQ